MLKFKEELIELTYKKGTTLLFAKELKRWIVNLPYETEVKLNALVPPGIWDFV